jgi:hypothetical protein
MRAAVVLAVLLAAPAAAEDIVLPDGQTVTLSETIRDAAGPAGLTDRFRFTAPWITGAAYEDLAAAMDWLCTTIALPRVVSSIPPPAQIVISLADRPVPFGATDPAATQVFEGFAIAGDTCEPEFF